MWKLSKSLASEEIRKEVEGESEKVVCQGSQLILLVDFIFKKYWPNPLTAMEIAQIRSQLKAILDRSNQVLMVSCRRLKSSSKNSKLIDHTHPSQVDASVHEVICLVTSSSSYQRSVTNTLCSRTTIQLYLSMKNDPQLQQQDISIWLCTSDEV
ncbi:hypothetical protein Tco_1175563 [Tanacetum coccineum]